MHVIVVGCGRVGSEVALNLASTEHDVIVIDRKVESFRRLGDNFKGTTMVGVGFDRDVLIEAGITPKCAVAAVTSYKRYDSERLQERPAGDFDIGVRFLPTLKGMPPAPVATLPVSAPVLVPVPPVAVPPTTPVSVPTPKK